MRNHLHTDGKSALWFVHCTMCSVQNYSVLALKNSIVLENFPFTYLCIIHKSTALQFRVAKVNFPTSPSLMPLPLCPVEYFIGDRGPGQPI